MDLVDPSGPQPGLLPAIVARYAEPLVAHLLAALAAASAADTDLAASLVDAVGAVCGAAHFLPEMAADRWGARWARIHGPGLCAACIGEGRGRTNPARCPMRSNCPRAIHAPLPLPPRRRTLQLLADPGCWGTEEGADGPAAPPCCGGPLLLLGALCRQHPPALSLVLARLCGGNGQFAANCLRALERPCPWATAPLIGCGPRVGVGPCW
jgi:hypothetical protein